MTIKVMKSVQMQKQYYENGRYLPIIAETDVLVCGAGPAGIGASLMSGRLGVKTMVVESQSVLGGIATAGMMSHWTGHSSSKILQEIFRMQAEAGKEFGHVPEINGYLDKAINQEHLAIILDQMMKEANVDVLLCTMVCDVIMDGNTVTGVIVENKSGRGVIKAKVIVDATGDGDVAYHAGVPFFKGRETDGKMQPCTLMFKIGGVDYSKAVFPGAFENLVFTPKGELQDLSKKLLPYPCGHVLLMHQRTSGTVCCNMTNAIEIDGTNGFDVTKALIQCRSQIPLIINFLREYAPGYENCYLLSFGSLLGVRETRHFEGVYSLTADDIESARLFEDRILEKAYFNFDVHNLTGPGLDSTGVQDKWTQPNFYTIPYGCLLPKTVEGLLLSGRNICGSHLAHANYRAMPVCLAIGEAAGVAAALFVKNGARSLKEVKPEQIRDIVNNQ